MVSWGSFNSQVRTNVFEINFIRRLPPPPGYVGTRRMLCTRSKELLDSPWGRKFLNYTVPSGKLPYDPYQKNLVIVFDFMRQDWRAVPCESCNIVTTISIKNDEELNKFYFDWFAFLRRMGNGAQFKNWMNSTWTQSTWNI
jgi:hypothetical protein